MPQTFNVTIKAKAVSAEGTDVEDTEDLANVITQALEDADIEVDVEVDDDDSDEAFDTVAFKLNVEDIDIIESS